MTNTYNHAEIELDILTQSATDPDNRPVIEAFRDEILAICEKFGNSGQSGGSAPYTARALSQAIEKLCLFEPLMPIMGVDDEWFCCVGGDDTTINEDKFIYQNKRCGSIFKEGKNGKPYYLDAIAFIDTKGNGWTGGANLPDGNVLRSRQFIKEFPFTPKTFKINVVDVEVTPGDWDFTIEEVAQLDNVFEYYARN